MKKTVALFFGGKSSEHEVSILSAKNIAAALDKKNYDLVLVGISHEGTWYGFDNDQVFARHKSLHDAELKGEKKVALISQDNQAHLFYMQDSKKVKVDVAFPILHGTYGEDGCVQGLFKMMNVAFVGSGVLASSVGMDKDFMKRLFRDGGLSIGKFIVLRKTEKYAFAELEKKLGLPFFIKPANGGSSVGVYKIKSESDFNEKINSAFLYDSKVLAEEFIEGREIECAVMGLAENPQASIAGEVIPTHEFYSYEAKYLDENGAAVKIPTEVAPEVLKKIQTLAKQAYQCLGCDGLTRVDFFLKKNGEVYINEVNTLPGFTNISMYPKMWEASGIKYSDLISKLINFAFEKQAAGAEIKTER